MPSGIQGAAGCLAGSDRRPLCALKLLPENRIGAPDVPRFMILTTERQRMDTIPRHRWTAGRQSRHRWWKPLALMAFSVGLLVANTGTASAIIGGQQVHPFDFPYFVKVVSTLPDGSQFDCGGTVIADSVVLTAAHCVDDGVQASGITVYVWDQQPEGAIGLTLHPLWDGDNGHGHDLAIIRLAPFATSGVVPVQVGSPWDTSVYDAGVQATSVGHGRTSNDGPGTNDLYALHASIRSDSDMDDVYNRWWTPDWWISELMIGFGNSDHTICFGDSGGPLTVASGTSTVLVGVVSMVFRNDCNEAGGFAEVRGPQLAWIASQVPQIIPGWGACTSPTGNPGYPVTVYNTYQSVGDQTDGSRYWRIACVSNDPPPPTSTPAPPPPPPPATPPQCRNNPRCVEN